MKTNRIVRLAAAFGAALLALPGAAQTVRPTLNPGPGYEGYVDYVGRYGEVFKLRGGWDIDPFMSGDIEVINLHPGLRQQGTRGIYRPFKPAPSDYEPAKFTELALIQLMIIPRSSDAFRSLEDLKKAKLKDLAASGVSFKVLDRPFFPAFRGDWPAGTFEIIVERPYRLAQLYTATSSHTCILTTGLDSPPTMYIRDHYDPLLYGLATWVVPQERPTPDESPAAIVAGGATFHFTPVIFLTWALITGLGCLLAGGLQIANRWDALRRLSLAVVISSNIGAVLGAAFGLALWPFAWFTHHLPIPGGLACLLMLPLAFRASRGRGKARRRVLAGIALWTFVSAAFIGYYGSYDWGGGAHSRYVIAYNTVVGFVFFAIGGFIFGVLDSSDTQASGKSGLLALAALLTAASGQAQGLDAARFDAQARANVAGRVTEEFRRDVAKKELKKTRDIYDLQRVEVKGILSPNAADNDTNAVLGPMFDLQVAPTHLKKTGALPVWMQPSKALLDVVSLNRDAFGQLSAAAEAAVEQIGQQEVNELVAHSWGTEIVYNAILAGLIRPPKKLIVAGMPDGDLEKWKALAKFTGTQVIVYTNPNDPIAGAARLAGKAREVLEDIKRRVDGAPPPLSTNTGFWLKWKDACDKRRDKNPCNPQHRTPETVAYRDVYQDRTHDRYEYYKAMEDAHDLPAQPRDQRIFPDTKMLPFPGSAPALASAQNALIEQESQRMYAAEVKEEVDALIAAAQKAQALAQKAKGRFGFLDDVKEESTRARQEVQAQDDDYTEWYRRFDALLTRAEETRRQEKAGREYKRELGRHSYEFGYLSAAAGMSCADSDGFVEEVRKGRYTSVSMDRQYLAEYLTMASFDGGLSPCQMELLTKIKNSDRSVSWSDLLAWGRQYRDANPTLGRRVGRALKAFRDSFDAFGSDVASESRRPGEERSRSPRSDEERSRPPRSESPKVDCFIDSNGIRACCVANC